MSRISVIIPTFQHAQTLSQSLDSLFAQSRLPDEVIVVDDGSTDDTLSVLTPYRERITYVYQENQGAPSARNHGFDLSTGDLVIFWDADVIGKPEMLEHLECSLNEHPDASWSYASFYWGRKRFHGKPFDVQALRKQNYIHTTALIRASAFIGFDPRLKRFQDWDLWLSMAEQGKKGVFVDEVLFQVLVESDRSAYSSWMPKLAYRLPWNLIGWMPDVIRRYEALREVIVEKHTL